MRSENRTRVPPLRSTLQKNKLHRKPASQAVLFQLFDRDLLLKSRTSTPQTSSPFSIQIIDTAFCPHSQVVARVLTRPCPPCQGLSISSTGPINFIIGERRGRVPRQVFL